MDDFDLNGWAFETEELLDWRGRPLRRIIVGYRWSQPPASPPEDLA